LGSCECEGSADTVHVPQGWEPPNVNDLWIYRAELIRAGTITRGIIPLDRTYPLGQ
jgi:hypothetical protein